jgi:hypothetical protein
VFVEGSEFEVGPEAEFRGVGEYHERAADQGKEDS